MQYHKDVLIIDDHEEQANLIRILLEQYGLSAQYITDSTEAMDEIRTIHPKIIILDLMMPEIDGLRLCKMIKADKSLADIKIIIYSGKLYEADRRKALDLGADLFLTKPTRSYILVDAIRNLISETENDLIKN